MFLSVTARCGEAHYLAVRTMQIAIVAAMVANGKCVPLQFERDLETMELIGAGLVGGYIAEFRDRVER